MTLVSKNVSSARPSQLGQATGRLLDRSSDDPIKKVRFEVELRLSLMTLSILQRQTFTKGVRGQPGTSGSFQLLFTVVNLDALGI